MSESLEAQLDLLVGAYLGPWGIDSSQRPSQPPNALSDIRRHKGSKSEQDAGPFRWRCIEGVYGIQPDTDALRARVDVPNQATTSSSQPH